MKVIGVIPARHGSSRLPGKPLLLISGKPMIWWVYERVKNIKKIDEIYVATDDECIEKVCREFEVPVIMTSDTHLAAANRLQEVSRTIEGDFYIQINGDEPLIQREAVEAAIPDEIPQDREFGTNIITPVEEPAQVMDASNIKVVFDKDYRALYMSRTPIPYPFKSLDFRYYKHVGIIGYNKKMLDFYAASEPGRQEQTEGIDTLRFLDYGKELKLIPVENLHTLSVDTEKDLDVVRNLMEKIQKM